MPDPSTTRLALYKSLSDGSELVSYTLDIGQNWDKVDAAAGFQVVTSSTRPSSPYSGKGIAESDTSYRTYFSNGTAPASASWVQIPNSSSTFNADLDLTSGKQINIGSSGSTASLAVVNTTAATDLISGRVTGDSQSRYIVDTDGTTTWGPGGASAVDTTLARTGVGALTLTGALTVSTNISVAGSGAITGAATVGGTLGVTGNLTVAATTWTPFTPTITNGGSVTWTTRTGYYYKLGKIVFVCIYLVVNGVGTGSSLVAVDMPSSAERTNRQALTLHAETIGANGNATSSIRGGECVFLTGGSGATSDRLRVDNGTSNESNIQGVDLLTGGSITIQGWYREA